MHRLPRYFRWIAALLVLTSTPGLGELVEGVVHAAIESDDTIEHHAIDSCNDSCTNEGCTVGFFHTCRCNAAPMAPLSATCAVPEPLESTAVRASFAPSGGDLLAHRIPPFRPPSV